MEAEYGSVGGIRFLNPEQVRLYDADGNVVLCKCGKPAGQAAMGKDAFIAWCSDCSPANKQSAEFVYRTPSEEQKQKLREMGFVLPEDAWTL